MSDIVIPDETVIPEVQLVGLDSNAGVVMGTVARALKKVGNSTEIVDNFYNQAMSGDYNHMLSVCMAFSELPDDD